MTKFLLIASLLLIAVLLYWSYKSDITKNIDPYVYELPYKEGTSHFVMQGYGGLFSHKNAAALDFSMPEGTAIYASREGEVYRYKDDSNEGGPFSKYHRKANYIMIQHNDGSIGCYWHLKQYGVVTKTGKVSRGQLIGYSGATGFVVRPHLHFSVKPVLSYSMDGYIQTTFKTAKGAILLKQGRSYKRPFYN